jgi:hypothetical protein
MMVTARRATTMMMMVARQWLQRLMTSGQHNNQLTICHEGSNLLAVKCPAVDESPTRQPY